MVESRWLRWFGPGLVALGAVGLIASTTIGAGPRTWTPRACLGPSADRVAAARAATPAAPADLAGVPWYRLDAIVGDDGALRRQHLDLGRFGERVTHGLDLPAESFAAGPFGRIVLVGSDDGSLSHLEAMDLASGCSWSLASERDVIRRATIDPAGASIFEMRVDRASRADLGIWRRPIDGTAAAERVLPPIASDDRFGRTFSTEFTWDLAGDRVVVQSCGQTACRTRVVSPDGGPTRSLEALDLGLIVGIDGDRVVTYMNCRGLPCPIVSTDIVTGERTTIADAAGLATLTVGPDGARLVHETSPVPGSRLRSVRLDGGGSTDLTAMPADERLATTPLLGGSGTGLPGGWILLAPDGRIPIDPFDHRPQLRHVPDGTAVALDEALR